MTFGDRLVHDDRSRMQVTDLSQVLRGRRKTENGIGGVDAREKIRAKSSAENTGVKSRLGSVVTSGATGPIGLMERKRKYEISSGDAMRPAIFDIKQSIVKAVKENERKTLKHETFIEKKAKTGEAIVWDSKLSRPRMGMVADMTDSARISAKDRLHQSGDNCQSEEVIKRIVPNRVPKPATVSEEKSGQFRNVVWTEVVEEEVPVIQRTVVNDYNDEMEDDDGGFFGDRIVMTRDKFTEMKIEQQKIIRPKHSTEYDLETDVGTDLPDIGNEKFVFQVRNSPSPSRAATQRPVLEAKRSQVKTKQMREVMLELREIKEKERGKDRREVERERREAESRERRREDEIVKNKKREILELEKKKADSERRKIRELEAKRQEEEKKLEALKKKSEELKLEQELKKKEETLKVEEEERKIAGIYLIRLLNIKLN